MPDIIRLRTSGGTISAMRGDGLLAIGTRHGADSSARLAVSLAHGAREAPGYEALSAAVRTGTRVAIWLAKRF